MTRQNGPRYDENYLRQGSPTNATFGETIPRFACAADLAIAATGVVLSTAIPLQAGDIVTNVTFVVGGTAASVPTAGFVALYSAAATPALMAQSADFGSTARAANTAYTVALATPQLITDSALYYVSISFTATTVPTLRGASLGNAVVSGALGVSAKVLAQTHGSAVGGTAPATIATPTATASVPYIVVT